MITFNLRVSIKQSLEAHINLSRRYDISMYLYENASPVCMHEYIRNGLGAMAFQSIEKIKTLTNL